MNPHLSIYLLTLREEEARAHPLAEVPILKYRPKAWQPTYSYWIQVSGDLIAILFRPGMDRFGEPRPEQPAADELVVWVGFGAVPPPFNFVLNEI